MFFLQGSLMISTHHRISIVAVSAQEKSAKNSNNVPNPLLKDIICREHLLHLTNTISIQEIAHNLSIGSDISGIHAAILCKLPAFKGLPITVIGLTDDEV